MRDRTLVVTASALANGTVCLQWMLLLAGSVLFILGMLSAGLPGAWLLGPMMAGSNLFGLEKRAVLPPTASVISLAPV